MTDEELAALLDLLERTRALDPASPQFLSVERAAAHLEKSAKKKRRLARSQRSRAEDRAKLNAPAGERLNRDRPCYVCKRGYRDLDAKHPLLCPDCAGRSDLMRRQPLDLRGRRALLTGGRIKIGFATALRMLRAGAEVHLTTRWPADAARRFAAQTDAAEWSARLHVHGLDLRELGRVVATLETLRAGPPFDIVVNNAAQSVWHPPEYFEALAAGERGQLPAGIALHSAPDAVALAVPLAIHALDARRDDSWVQRLGEVAAVEMVEVTVVNAIAPYLVCSLMLDSLRRSAHPDRFIVNVSAVEGQFGRPEKSTRHPHTNMAKAGLNMLTRTSAADLAAERIFMVSVDPGWMSREGKDVEAPAQLPLDAEDCAARVLHPIAQGLAGEPLSGVLLKDFIVVPW